MKIYELEFDVDNYKSIELTENRNADFYQMFDGRSLKEAWDELTVKYYDEDEGLKTGDAPGFTIPVFNKKSLDILFTKIKNEVEILPLRIGNENLYGINVLTILDAVNYEKSDYKMFRDGKRIMKFNKISFKDSIIQGKNIFKIVDLKRSLIFVSEEFKRIVEENGLEGFLFELAWDSSAE